MRWIDLTNRIGSWRSAVSARGLRERAAQARRGSGRLRGVATRNGEALEQRWVPDGAGLVWGAAPRMDLSFVPDGTAVFESTSNLNAKFDAVSSRGEWQTAIWRAFQTWAVSTNADFGRRTDSGAPLGAAGAASNDPRFGEIRIASAPLSPGVMALSIPGTAVSGTWLGDLVFNSNATFASVDAIFAVALHEAGNILGLQDNQDPLSPMSSGTIPLGKLPTPQDVAALQQKHGVRQPDAHDRPKANDDVNSASQLAWNDDVTSARGTTPLVTYGDLTTPSDVDYYGVEMLSAYHGPVTFRLRTSELSALRSQLTVLSREGAVLATAAATEPGEDLQLTIPAAQAGEGVQVRVAGQGDDVFRQGGYALTVTWDSLLAASAAELLRYTDGRWRDLEPEDLQRLVDHGGNPLLLNDDLHSDDSAEEAGELVTSPGYVEGSRYDVAASLGDGQDVDWYSLDPPSVPDQSTAVVLTIRAEIWKEAQFAELDLTLWGPDDEPLPARPIVNDQGVMLWQWRLSTPLDTMSLRVQAAADATPAGAGNYDLQIAFGGEPITVVPVARGTWTDAGLPHEHSLTIYRRPQIVHFIARSTSESAAGTTKFRFLTEQGAIVFETEVASNRTRSASAVLLPPGAYRVEVEGVGVAGARLDYELAAVVVSDPLLVDVQDPTEEPIKECPKVEGVLCIPGDLDLDQDVDWSDFVRFRDHYGFGGGAWQLGDWDGNGLVDVHDLFDLARNFGTNTSLPRNRIQLQPANNALSSPFNAPASPVWGDFDADLDVDSADVLYLISNWTGADAAVATRTMGEGDIDADGDIDSADLLDFISNWTVTD